MARKPTLAPQSQSFVEADRPHRNPRTRNHMHTMYSHSNPQDRTTLDVEPPCLFESVALGYPPNQCLWGECLRTAKQDGVKPRAAVPIREMDRTRPNIARYLRPPAPTLCIPKSWTPFPTDAPSRMKGDATLAYEASIRPQELMT